MCCSCSGRGRVCWGVRCRERNAPLSQKHMCVSEHRRLLNAVGAVIQRVKQGLSRPKGDGIDSSVCEACVELFVCNTETSKLDLCVCVCVCVFQRIYSINIVSQLIYLICVFLCGYKVCLQSCVCLSLCVCVCVYGGPPS